MSDTGEDDTGEDNTGEDSGPASSDKLVFLTGAGNNNEAAILRGYLEHHGIYVYVQGEQHRSMLGMVGAYIELRLMVPEDKLAEAQELLELFHAEQDEPVPGAEFRGAYRDEGEDPDDQYDDDVIDKVRLKNTVRRARLFGFVFPGGAHYAARAPVRGMLTTIMAFGSVFLAATQGPAWVAMYLFAVLFDIGSVRGPLFEQELKLARAENKQLAAKTGD